jgi:hypothetical protein
MVAGWLGRSQELAQDAAHTALMLFAANKMEDLAFEVQRAVQHARRTAASSATGSTTTGSGGTGTHGGTDSAASTGAVFELLRSAFTLVRAFVVEYVERFGQCLPRAWQVIKTGEQLLQVDVCIVPAHGAFLFVWF